MEENNRDSNKNDFIDFNNNDEKKDMDTQGRNSNQKFEKANNKERFSFPPYPPYPPYSTPEYQQPQEPPYVPPPKKKRRILSLLFGLIIIFAGFFLFLIFIGGISMLIGRMPTLEPRVAVVEINGSIGGGLFSINVDEIVRQIEQFAEDSMVKALVVRIDSPGGTVGSVQEIYDAILRYRGKTRKPVIASLGDVAASGGYYIASAAQEIYSNPGTLTGSIGVIFNLVNVEELIKKVGMKFDNVKSGKFKDIGSSTRPITEEERRLLTEVITDVYNQFIEAILNTRESVLLSAMQKKIKKFETEYSDTNTTPTVNVKEIRKYLENICDGRVFSGRQAFEYGLVDKLGTYHDAIQRAAQLGGIVGKPKILKPRRKTSMTDFLFGGTKTNILNKINDTPYIEYKLSFP